MRRPNLDRPSFDVDRQIGRGPVQRLYAALIERHTHRSDPDPSGRARLDIERLLAAAFDDLAKHYSGRKKAALDALVKLQKQALDFYDGVLAGTGPSDVARLETILKDMDRNFRELARKADDLAGDLPPLSRTELVDPTTGVKTVEYGGGADAGGSTYVVEPGDVGTSNATMFTEGPHPGRRKGALPDPVGGLVPGEHRGHMGPEGAVADPRIANVVENLISEAAHSNLSPKKKFDNLITKVSAALPGRVQYNGFAVRQRPDVPRPDAMTHRILVDGKVVYQVTIPNE